jgi:hypothetical protein
MPHLGPDRVAREPKPVVVSERVGRSCSRSAEQIELAKTQAHRLLRHPELAREIGDH